MLAGTMESIPLSRVGITRVNLRFALTIWAVLLLYFAPAAIMYVKPFASVYGFVKYIRCMLCVLLGIRMAKRTKGRIENKYILLALFFVALLLSSAFGDINLSGWINTTLSIVGLYLAVDFFSQRNTRLFLYYSFLFFFILLMVNDALMIVYPETIVTVTNQLGNQSFYFLTSKNTFAMFCFPCLMLAHICYESSMIKGRLLYLSIALSLYPIIVAHSVTSTICILLLEAFVFLLPSKHREVINIQTLFVLVIVLSILQLLFTYLFEIDFIQRIIVSVLGKDPTMSGRSMLYSSAHELIRSHLLLGMGNGMDGYYYYTVAPGYAVGGIMWAHNTSLDLLTQGGIVLYLCFYLVEGYSFKGIAFKRSASPISWILICMLMVYTVMGFTERFGMRYDMHFMLALASILPKKGASIGLINTKQLAVATHSVRHRLA